MNGIEDRARSFFLAALDRPADLWPAFLDEACDGDAELRIRVEGLLSAHAAMGSIHGGQAGLLTDTVDALTERPGTVIGPYKLMEEIGEGGMGLVFVAEQSAPVHRRVALKVVKPGMDTRQVVARFEAERQALALMDHPNIARVFDGGTTPAGRPYFVMELVKGVPITDFCDEHRLPVRERLSLFADVCSAVQHAHQKGIIHRDIKPSNVLVSSHDGRPVVKVIDFGVAKAVGQRLTDKTVYTQWEQLLGTPMYMSPEQAGQSGLDVDTRTDIYALGVLLYELLTGTTPFDSEKLRTAGFDEFRRIIREVEPAKPSTRISTLGAEAETVSARRRAEPGRLHQLVRGELDWIVMKALEKDRTRRYDSASAFAADVTRYLSGEPVLAVPPSLGYQVRTFVRRNRGLVVSSGLVLASLAAGLAGTTWGLVRADEQRVRAEANEQAALTAAAAEKEAKVTAEEREAETRAALEFVEERVFAAARPLRLAGGLGQDVTLRQALEAATPFVAGSFRDRPTIEARLRNTLGITFAYLGDAKASEEQFARARDLYAAVHGPDHRLTLACRHNLANAYRALNRPKESLALHQEVLARRRATLDDDHPDTIKSLIGVANAEHALNHHQTAYQLRTQILALCEQRYGLNHRETLQAAHNLANSLMELGQLEEAKVRYEEALERWKAHHPEHPDALVTMTGLGDCLSRLDLHPEAVQVAKGAFELKETVFGKDHLETLTGMMNLSAAYARANRFDEALKIGQRALEMLKVKPGPDHPVTLMCMGNVAWFLTDLGTDDDEAVRLIDDCLRRAAGKPVAQALAPKLLPLRLRVFEKKKDATGCRTTTEKWEAVANRTRPDPLVLSARMRAVTAKACSQDPKFSEAERTRRADEEAGLAINWLKKAVVNGYRDVKYLREEPDFAVLRDRPEFKSLLIELEKLRK